MSTDDIATQCGYGSIETFRDAGRRFELTAAAIAPADTSAAPGNHWHAIAPSRGPYTAANFEQRR